MGDSAHRKALQ